MSSTDVIVIGGGPAGYNAALAAASRGCQVTLLEPELLGGMCVNFTCIPGRAQMEPVLASVHHEQLHSLGIYDAVPAPSLRSLRRHRSGVVSHLRSSIAAALAAAGVEVKGERATLIEPTVARTDSGDVVSAQAVVITTGARWEVPSIPGVRASKVLTADAALDLSEVPTEVAVLASGVGETAFALEYAAYFAALGTDTSLVVEDADRAVVQGLDPALDTHVREGLELLGVSIRSGWSDLESLDGPIVAVDCRVPSARGLGLEDLGLDTSFGLSVDDWGQTKLGGLFAAGDVTGTGMTSASAAAAGRLVGLNASGAEHPIRLHHVPSTSSITPPVAWVGAPPTTLADRAEVGVGTANISHNPAGVLSGLDGLIRLTADRRTGEILGVHMVGPGAVEVIELAASLMQAEVTYEMVADLVTWHPSAAESLIQAARSVR